MKFHHLFSSAVSLLLLCSLNAYGNEDDPFILVSVPDQKMAVMKGSEEVARYAVSTSRFGLGDRLGSYATPLGRLEIAKKIGDAVQQGTVFKTRQPTGEVLRPNAPGRDPIVTRILWLRGLEPRNSNAFSRMIYIHGTPEERTLGSPSSYGCIRMRSNDIVQLFAAVGSGARVVVDTAPLPEPAIGPQVAKGNQASLPQ